MTNPVSPPASVNRPKIALVLAGGAARGAYEVGVVEYIVEQVAKDLGYDVPLDILCGTSVGAMNVCTLAAFADEPRGRVARLAAMWKSLRIEELFQTKSSGWYGAIRGLLSREFSFLDSGAVFEPRFLEQFLRRSIPFERIDTHLRAQRLAAVTVSATQIVSGRTVVFVQRRRARPAAWPDTADVVPRAVRLRPVHALASAAVPLLFPPVKIDGRYYCDGGLRQNIPLSPARRLGAAGMIIVNPRYRAPVNELSPADAVSRESSAPSLLFLLGKTLNALMLDRIDNDLDRLEKINDILDAGSKRYGEDFSEQLGVAMGGGSERPLKRVQAVHIRSSQNIGKLCADYVRSPEFHVPGMLGRLMKRIAEGETTREADLLSYVLLDGDFATQLIELGRQDARQHHESLCQLFDSLCQPGGR